MVRTFTHEEPSLFGTLGSQWVPGQTQSLSSLGPKVRIQTHRSPKNKIPPGHVSAFLWCGNSLETSESFSVMQFIEVGFVAPSKEPHRGNSLFISVRVHSAHCRTEPAQAGQVEHEEKFSCAFVQNELGFYTVDLEKESEEKYTNPANGILDFC